MVALAVFQALLDALGWVLASIHDVVGNYGVAIIGLTIVIRVVLLPLGIKQIKSMQAMQAIGPKVKEIQKKYKGNRQKAQEETMKLYKEAGVNPLGGCLPLLLQLPILIGMYAVIRSPVPNAAYDPANPERAPAYLNNHLPEDSQLYRDVTTDGDVDFLWMNLQCSASQSGDTVRVPDSAGEPSDSTLDCGNSVPDKIPYFVFLALMIGTTYYQQRQMQTASPPGAASSQQQAILRFMPLLFGIFGFSFPSGLVVYWTTSNLWQIGQQAVLLRAGHIGPGALERRMAEQKAKQSDKPARRGFIASMMDRAEEQRTLRNQGTPRPSSGGRKGGPGSTGGTGGTAGGRGGGAGGKGGASGRSPGRGAGGSRAKGTKGTQRPNDRRRKPGSGGGGGTGGTGDGGSGS
jgi:YidC/Oxa1 family membrane protein insertase